MYLCMQGTRFFKRDTCLSGTIFALIDTADGSYLGLRILLLQTFYSLHNHLAYLYYLI
jgi:hypothetical protein